MHKTIEQKSKKTTEQKDRHKHFFNKKDGTQKRNLCQTGFTAKAHTWKLRTPFVSPCL